MRGRVLAIWLACFGAAQAAEQPAWPEGGAMGVGELHVRRRDTAAAGLKRAYAELLRLASQGAGDIQPDERTLAALKTQQAAWTVYMKQECELVGALTGAGGSWPSTYAVRCEANLTELRLRRARAAVRCLAKLPVDRRVFSGSECLYQLTPLAVPLRP